MAFTKKTKATPKPVSCARKSKKSEPEVEQDVQEDVESDYEDAPESEGEEQEQEYEQEQEPERSRPSSGYSRNNYARPSNQSRGNRSSYGHRNQQAQGDGNGVRVTGLFAGKREGLWTGRLRKEDIENLMGLLDSALNSNQLVTMFLWENQDDPQFSLTANLAQEFKGGGGGNRYNRGGGGNRFNRGYRGSIGRR